MYRLPVGWRGAIGLVMVPTLMIAGCGGGDHRVRDATDRELIARVSAAIHAVPYPTDVIAYADLAAAREQLGLPGDAGFPGVGKRRLLFAIASRPLFSFTTLFREPHLGVIGELLDTRQIEAAASTNLAFSGPGSDQVYKDDVMVVRTRQPFAQIASRLRSKGGYAKAPNGLLRGGRRPSGQVLSVVRSPRRLPFRVVANAGGGAVVLAGSTRAARAALQGGELTPAAKLLVELPGVSRVAKRGGGGPCVVAIGLGEDAAPHEGELRVVVHGEAQATHFLEPFAGQTLDTGFPGPEAQLAFSEATAEGNRASVRFDSTDERYVARLAIENVAHAYNCRAG